MAEKDVEEVLEVVWTKEEEGSPVGLRDLLKLKEAKVSRELLEKMAEEGYISLEDEGAHLKPRGQKLAVQVVRRHRLAERLLCDVLEVGAATQESTACEFEHILGTEVADAICTLLGHPTECPHGKPIPRGKCCQKEARQLESVVVPLSELKSGSSGRVAYIVTRHHDRLDKLTSMGVFPGAEIKVHQTFPSFVIRVEETDIALDAQVLKDVYVRRKPS